MNEQSILAGLSEQYRALIGNPALTHQVFDSLPLPVQIFAPDGTCIFVNRAGLELHHMPDAGLLVGKYNFNDDPVCLEIMGQEVYDRVSRGEAVAFPDFPAPIRDMVKRGVVDEKPFEAATMDLFFQPVWDGGAFVCTILFYSVKNMFDGRADVGRAKAYIRAHWREKFDLEAVTAAAGSVSGRHLRRIFKELTGRSPREYYQKVKLEKIQEKLLDSSMTVAEVFTVCGTDPHGTYLQLFKEKTGMTPTEYRKEQLKN